MSFEKMDEMEALRTRIETLEAAVGRLTLEIEKSPIALEYPEPIATALAREAGAVLHHERFFSLMDAGETCIKYTAALAIALMRSVGQPPDLSECFEQPLALGGWAKLTRESLQSGVIPDNPLASDLKTSLIKPNGKPTSNARYLFDEFINLRNEYRGHTSSLADTAYKNLHLRHAPMLHDTLKGLTYLRYPLVRVESVMMEAKGFSYDVKLLVGPSPLSQVRRIQSESKIGPNATCTWDGEQILLDLGEIVTYRTCPACNLEHTFFIERRSSTFLDYHTYCGNHRFRYPVASKEA